MKETDAWCQTYASAVGIDLGLTEIIPVECSCGRAIELWKKLGRWKEDDSYKANVGDYIYYDWDDTTGSNGDNTGWPDHVGIVYSVDGNDMVIIEGNVKDSVGFRKLKVNGKYIRGYGLPNYASKSVINSVSPITTSAEKTSEAKPESSTAKLSSKSVKATDAASGVLKSLAGTYKVVASALNVRHGAGTSKSIMVTIPKGTVVKNYGYYSTYQGVKWLYIQFAYNGIQYTGFASSKYLKK